MMGEILVGEILMVEGILVTEEFSTNIFITLTSPSFLMEDVHVQ